jgi:hypothetical protein
MRRVLLTFVFALALSPNAHGLAWGGYASSDELTLKVETSKQTYSPGEPLAFAITVRNEGAEKFLYGGMALGRTRIWSAFGCEVIDEKRREIPLGLTWGVAAVAGRLDPFALHLDSGAAYRLNVTPKDYLFFDYRPAGIDNLAKQLPAGRYRLRCEYKSGRDWVMRTLAVWEGDTFVQLWERHPEFIPKTWEGQATSDEYGFRVLKSK